MTDVMIDRSLADFEASAGKAAGHAEGLGQ